MPRATRKQLGPLLPELCLAFLEPDVASHQFILEGVGVPADLAVELVSEAFPAHTSGAEFRRPLAGTLSLFKRVGVLDDPETRDAFRRWGLIP